MVGPGSELRRNRIELEIIERPEGVKGFLVLARRWVAERAMQVATDDLQLHSGNGFVKDHPKRLSD
jgi:alkylation response protein AidB-like acyl-CoA dehydrogenase